MARLKQVGSAASIALVLAVAASTGCVLLTLGLTQLFDEATRTRQSDRRSYSSSLAMVEGHGPVIVRRQSHPYHSGQTFDLNGRRTKVPGESFIRNLAFLAESPPREVHWSRRIGAMRLSHPRRVATGVRNGENWFAVPDGKRSGRYCFQGMQSESGQIVGYVGRDGFQEKKPVRENQFVSEFAGPHEMLEASLSADNGSRMVLRDERNLLAVNFTSRSVTRLIDEPIVSMARLDRRIAGSGYTMPSEHATWAIRTAERVDIIERRSGIVRSFSIPAELRKRPFHFFTQEDRALYFTLESPAVPDPIPDPYEWTRNGELVGALETGEITSRQPVALSSRIYDNGGLSDDAGLRCAVAAVPSTLWSTWFGLGGLRWLLGPDLDLTFSQSFQQTVGTTWWVVVLVAVLCGWLAWRTYRHQREHGEPNGWFWAMFVFFLGLPGYVGYRLHRHWPNREPLAAPEPTGFEVFAN